jgi:hypothetical protein
MTAAYRLRGIGWMAVLLAVVLGFYLVSLRVAAERKKLDDVNGRIASAERDIRALDTEFDTRANLAQLEKWNGDTLALAAPTAGQFVASDAQLAALDPAEAGGPELKTAALVVPSQPQALAPTPAPASAAPALAPRPAVVMTAAVVQPATPTKLTAVAAMEAVAPTGRAAPALARLAEAARGRAAEAKVRPQAVAMLDRKLLSDATFGDLVSGARAEARRR